MNQTRRRRVLCLCCRGPNRGHPRRLTPDSSSLPLRKTGAPWRTDPHPSRSRPLPRAFSKSGAGSRMWLVAHSQPAEASAWFIAECVSPMAGEARFARGSPRPRPRISGDRARIPSAPPELLTLIHNACRASFGSTLALARLADRAPRLRWAALADRKPGHSPRIGGQGASTTSYEPSSGGGGFRKRQPCGFQPRVAPSADHTATLKSP
jgi:hypothetical protein